MHDQTSESIARLLIDHVVCQCGVPRELLSDRGANFLSELMQEVCRLIEGKPYLGFTHISFVLCIYTALEKDQVQLQ